MNYISSCHLNNKETISFLEEGEKAELVECNNCNIDCKQQRVLKFTCNHKICEKCSFAQILTHISITSQGLSGNINQNENFPCVKCKKGKSEINIKSFFNQHVVKKSFTKNIYGKSCDACESFELKTYCFQCKSKEK